MGEQPGYQLRDADVLDDVSEEAPHNEPARLITRNTTGLQVEELFVIQPSGRTRVAGPDDLAGEDFQIRHRVGSGAVGEQKVAVGLVGVRTHGLRADDDVTDPDGPRLLALQRTTVIHPAPAIRR